MLYPPLRASAYSLSNSTLTKVSYCKGNIFFNILIAAINPTKLVLLLEMFEMMVL